MATYLCNAFSFNMVAASTATVKMTELTTEQAAELLLARSETWGWLGHRSIDPTVHQAIGHEDTARLFGRILDIDGIVAVRATVSLKAGDTVILGQYSGPRLPEGATVLPVGASIRWMRITVE